jgi:transposase InsO family protein
VKKKRFSVEQITAVLQQAAGLLPVPNGTLRYQSIRDRQNALRQRLRELVAVRVRLGYRRLTVLLRREGWRVNAKWIYRLYCGRGAHGAHHAAPAAGQPGTGAAPRPDTAQ